LEYFLQFIGRRHEKSSKNCPESLIRISHSRKVLRHKKFFVFSWFRDIVDLFLCSGSSNDFP
jgi:hypothetical protein